MQKMKAIPLILFCASILQADIITGIFSYISDDPTPRNLPPDQGTSEAYFYFDTELQKLWVYGFFENHGQSQFLDFIQQDGLAVARKSGATPILNAEELFDSDVVEWKFIHSVNTGHVIDFGFGPETIIDTTDFRAEGIGSFTYDIWSGVAAHSWYEGEILSYRLVDNLEIKKFPLTIRQQKFFSRYPNFPDYYREVIEFETQPGVRYILQGSDNLSEWYQIDEYAGTNSKFERTIYRGEKSQHYFRIVAEAYQPSLQ